MLKSISPNITLRPLTNSEIIFANEFERRYYNPKNYTQYQKFLYEQDDNQLYPQDSETKESAYSQEL